MHASIRTAFSQKVGSVAIEYRIKSVADFGAVPIDRIDALLADFKEFLIHSNQTESELTKLFGSAADGLISVGESFTWIDDGKVGIGAVDFFVGSEKIGRVEFGCGNNKTE